MDARDAKDCKDAKDDRQMMKGIPSNPRSPASGGLAPEELMVPGLALAASFARARRTVARARRLPGLWLFFPRAAGGAVKAAPAHVPALPWGVGLAPAWLWNWSDRQDRATGAPGPGTSPARAAAGMGVRGAPDPFVRRRIDVDLAGQPSAVRAERPGSLSPLVHRSSDAVTSPDLTASGIRLPEDGRERSRPSSGVVDRGDETAAPVLIGGLLGGATRDGTLLGSGAAVLAASLTGAGAPGAASLPPAIGRVPRESWTAGWNLASARPASVRVEREARPPAIAGAPPALHPSAVATRTAALAATAAAVGSAAGDSSPPDPMDQTHGTNFRDVDVDVDLDIAAPPAGVTAAALPDRLPWSRLSAFASPARPASSGQPDAAPGVQQAHDPSPAPALRWPAPASGAVPAVVTSVLEITESLRTYVTREVQQVKDDVERVTAARRPVRQPAAGPAATDDMARQVLGRMRTLMREERFRSGLLR